MRRTPIPPGPLPAPPKPPGSAPGPPRPPLSPVPPPPGPQAAASDPELSWDDDYESTSVFAKEQSRKRRKRARRERLQKAAARASSRVRTVGRLGLGAAALIGVIAIILAFTLPKRGALVITVAGPGNTTVDNLKVLVDDEERCQASPCRVADLAAGVHIVNVVAAGYPPMAGRAVTIESGKDAVLDMSLGRGSAGGTGLRVPALGRYLRLSLDGQDKGTLPIELASLKPGSYAVKISGNDRYAPYEEKVTIEAGKMLNLEPKLKVAKGRAKLKAGSGAQGAHVFLDCEGEDRLLVQLPTSVDVAVDKPCTLIARRKGYQEFTEPLTFEEGKAEKTFTVELAKAAGEAAGDQGAGKAAGARGTIKVNSIPRSTALLNGRPLGSTPTSATVRPGRYTVVFFHPKHGKKSVGVRVRAGGTAVASVTFK